ncbi:alpha/beta fold hydrolase [Streptosporangium sp. NBC_01639]|uniref:alpha/beta fold hydrolase n=1 Tax=Streptosporangium sp. NBC_01639 TaxID=2975948 RepID=UPI003866E32B|nr:alpha/beta fold hydrolase [Streptosporangium sp. NBC_01639]
MRAGRRLTKVAAYAFAVAAVGYSAWVPVQFLNTGLGGPGAYVSELAAADQPWSWLVRAADVLSGIACLTAVALVPDERPGRWATAGWLGLALLGVMTILDSGAFPLDCAALSDPSCTAAEAAGRVSAAHRIHTVTSALAAAGAILSLVALPVSALRRHRWPLIGYGGAVLAVLMTAATAWTLAAIASGAPVGVAQRFQVAVIGLWLLLPAVALWRDRTVPPPPKAHVLLEGAGTPPVLICAGMAAAWFHWDRVAADLGRDHLVIRFDRPGLGLSSGHRTPPTLREEAERIGALADVPMVVAHSAAGRHAEAFARLHPGRVAGLVLVDPSCDPVARPRGTVRAAAVRAVQRALPALGGTFGATVLAAVVLPVAHRLLMGAHDRARAVYGRGRVLAAALAEWLAYRDMAVELGGLRVTHPFPDVPVVILSAGPRDRCHRDLAALLNATLISLPDSGHEVELERPGAIAEAVRMISRFHDT